MIAKKLIYGFILTALIACSGREKMKVPKDVLPRQEMVAVLTDIHLVEGAKLGRKIMGDTVLVDVYFEKVYEKHHLTKEDFERSFDFYSTYPDEMDKMYEQVIENLNSIEVASPRWEDQVEKQEMEVDSIGTMEAPDSTKGTPLKKD